VNLRAVETLQLTVAWSDGAIPGKTVSASSFENTKFHMITKQFQIIQFIELR
jgi:hypothetical protein